MVKARGPPGTGRQPHPSALASGAATTPEGPTMDRQVPRPARSPNLAVQHRGHVEHPFAPRNLTSWPCCRLAPWVRGARRTHVADRDAVNASSRVRETNRKTLLAGPDDLGVGTVSARSRSALGGKPHGATRRHKARRAVIPRPCPGCPRKQNTRSLLVPGRSLAHLVMALCAERGVARRGGAPAAPRNATGRTG